MPAKSTPIQPISTQIGLDWLLTHIILAIGGVNPNCESDIDDNPGLPAALENVRVSVILTFSYQFQEGFEIDFSSHLHTNRPIY